MSISPHLSLLNGYQYQRKPYSDINALYSFLQENGLDLDSSPRNGIKLLDAKNNLNKLIDEISDENKRDEYQ